MKNNWIQYLSLVLCAIMLIIIIAQGKKLDEYQNVNVDMKGDGTGIFSGQIFLPVEGNNEVFLCTQISGGGLTTKEELGGWGDLSMLLPLQNSGGGWSGPEYRDGVMSSQFSISIRGFANRMLKVTKIRMVLLLCKTRNFIFIKMVNWNRHSRQLRITMVPEVLLPDITTVKP
ncbi:MAG: hypothetical protein IKB01_08970 [Lachnospiraceae bacterium]|nr:hypothetical protein [Lachnospiraceae bacterium]